MLISSYITDENGVAITGLTPKVTIYNFDTDTQVVVDADMTPSPSGPDGLYEYDFAAVNDQERYFVLVDSGNTLDSSIRYQHELIVPVDPKTPIVKFD